MSIVVFLFVGLIAGWIASYLIEGHDYGVLLDLAIGVVGAFVGGFILDLLGMAFYGFWAAFVLSLVGAVVFLMLLRLITFYLASRNPRTP